MKIPKSIRLSWYDVRDALPALFSPNAGCLRWCHTLAGHIPAMGLSQIQPLK